MVLGGLWLLAGLLAARLAAAVLRVPADERMPALDAWTGTDGALRTRGSLYDDGTFTGTPFSGLVLKPLTRAAEQSLGVAWTFGTLLLVVVLGVLAARALPEPVSARTRLLAPPVAVILVAVALPVRNTFFLGQMSMLPVLLTVAGWLYAGRRSGPVLIGIAAALQPSVLLFAPLLWLCGRRSAALAAAGTFAAATAVAWAALPSDSWAYWMHHVAGAGAGGDSGDLANQSLHGALLRLGLTGPVEVALAVVLGAGVAALALWRAARYARDGQPLLAAAVTGCAAIAVAPTTWQHQQLWILLAVVGRVGRRTQDRLVWPVFTVLVMTLQSKALVPKMDALAFVGDDATLIAALLAACAVPFLTRTSPVWERPVAAGRFTRPNLLLELLLIRVGYWLYSYVRSLAPDGRELAEGHGHQILSVERALGIDIEYGLNHQVADTAWLSASMDFYYATFHFLVPMTLLAWLYVTRPARYRVYRAALAFATLLGLVGFWAYPLAPPRLMPGLGYIDTRNGPQDFDDPSFGALTGLTNQYAAMPSLHIGWSLWCALVLWRLSPYRWLRWAGFLYPLATAAVIMGTANHYLLDAVGGAAVVAAGFLAARALDRGLHFAAYGTAGRVAARDRSGTWHRVRQHQWSTADD
ncbi:bifunctional glycosyltransferase 87/phosphatase PAP2 family protein [Streptomyces sp. NPDC051940]|uniref:bifunctional glycosyltransferase 87/phosphatase PAP2 family protein n=1 Tax=Streptomyces sp. NPDC051940 TaxID=3155675 RepID=UPI003423C86B